MPKDAGGRFGVTPRCSGCRAKRIRDARVRVRAMKLPTPPEKRCGRCLVTKPKEEFYADSCKKDGLFGHCKSCDRERRRNWKPRVAAVALAIPCKKVCPECLLELPSAAFSVDARRKDGLSRHCRTCASVRRAASQYSLSVAEARALRSSTACECCRKPISGREVCIDHCHGTGAVRGALCGMCNLMLGYANDNAEILRAGVEYLERKMLEKGAG
jgi:hypothetical protein